MEDAHSSGGPAVDAIASVRRRLEQTEPLDDAARLALLEELYREFERELDRDFGETPSPRR